jgi:hypothetical protein
MMVLVIREMATAEQIAQMEEAFGSMIKLAWMSGEVFWPVGGHFTPTASRPF